VLANKGFSYQPEASLKSVRSPTVREDLVRFE
jgi:hypothetical protein